MESAFEVIVALDWLLIDPLVPVGREKDQVVDHNGGRTSLCRSLSKQLALASLML